MLKRPFNGTGIKKHFLRYLSHLTAAVDQLLSSKNAIRPVPGSRRTRWFSKQPEKIKRFLFFLSQSLSVRRKNFSNNHIVLDQVPANVYLSFFKGFPIDLTCTEQGVQLFKLRILEIVLQRNHQLNILLRNLIRHSPGCRSYDMQNTQKSFFVVDVF